MDWKVMIVGAGPAGISTWLHLHKYFPDLAEHALVIEKAVFPRDKLCAGGVWRWSANVLKNLEVDLDIPSVFVSDIDFKFGKEIHHFHQPNCLRVVNRIDFDHALVKAALNRGLELKEDELFLDAICEKNTLIVKTSRGKYNVKALIGADGALSAVRKKIFPPQKQHLAPAVQIFAPADSQYDTEFDEKKVVMDFSPVSEDLQGYVYHFPCLRNGVPSIAHGTGDARLLPDKPKSDIKSIFKRELQCRNIYRDSKLWSSHPLRWFFPEDIISQPNVLLVGDAAGIEPAFGGGIHISLSYGEIAAHAIIAAFKSKDFSFHDYKQRLMTHYAGQHIQDCTKAAIDIFSGRVNPLKVVRGFFSNSEDSSHRAVLPISTASPDKDRSELYYDETYGDYASNWSKDHLHYGFWYDNTKTHEESLVNTIKEVVNYLDLKPGERLLDAGCGVGGSCRYIVENLGIETVGITLSKRLLDTAIELSKDIKNRSLLNIYMMDFNDTEFEDSSFDKIMGLESICHALNKEIFAREAYRLLKKNGRLVVADSFQVREDLNEDEEKMYDDVLNGWAIPNRTTAKKFGNVLEKVGFDNIQCIDKTPLIRKSSSFMHDGVQSVLLTLIYLVNEGKIPKAILLNNIAGLRQKTCLDLNIWGYKIFVAEKR